MKGKIIDSYYSEKAGFTKIVKATKYGTFEYIAKCEKEDKPFQNEWDGYKFCEYQCDIQALREKIKWMNQRLLGMKQLFYTFIEAAEVDEDGEFVDMSAYKAISDFIKSIEGQIEIDKSHLEKMEEFYLTYVNNTIEERQEFRKKYSTE